MTSLDYRKLRASAAQWMDARQDRVDWWRWTVLTNKNPDPETLGIDERYAFLIFSDFVHDGMLLPMIAPDGFEAYAINPLKKDLWQRATHPTIWTIRRNVSRIIEWVCSAIIGGIIGICISLWWDRLLGK